MSGGGINVEENLNRLDELHIAAHLLHNVSLRHEALAGHVRTRKFLHPPHYWNWMSFHQYLEDSDKAPTNRCFLCCDDKKTSSKHADQILSKIFDMQTSWPLQLASYFLLLIFKQKLKENDKRTSRTGRKNKVYNLRKLIGDGKVNANMAKRSPKEWLDPHCHESQFERR
ncbi:hypothetical protein Ahy_A09g045079 [Arachis hypogaea]|uniref:Uncharacterized protein n=1 Tax=Arachis hypogaea TaxID=3818 RepID=A0A445BLH5_ARAHY|nr:hypothetical protein Ahy_A09g045079 [Arachis hypogaea]